MGQSDANSAASCSEPMPMLSIHGMRRVVKWSRDGRSACDRRPFGKPTCGPRTTQLGACPE